jgi:hypothetical protein
VTHVVLIQRPYFYCAAVAQESISAAETFVKDFKEACAAHKSVDTPFTTTILELQDGRLVRPSDLLDSLIASKVAVLKGQHQEYVHLEND